MAELQFYPFQCITLVSQQAPVVTREQFVPQPEPGGVTRGTLAAAFAALRPLDRAHDNNSRHRHNTNHQCEQKHHLHA